MQWGSSGMQNQRKKMQNLPMGLQMYKKRQIYRSPGAQARVEGTAPSAPGTRPARSGGR